MQTNPNNKNAVVLYNPLAGRGKAAHYARQAESTLRNHEWEVLGVIASEYANHIENELAAKWESKVQMIILIGGDGTLRELVSGLRSAGSKVRIAFIPMGNANVVARELNIPLKPEQAIQLCISGQSKAIDLGLINHQDGKQTPFLAMIELGIGADIVRAVDQLRNGALEKLYKYWGDIVYVIGGLLATIKHKEPEFGFSMDGSTEQIRSSHAIIANMKTYAKGWSFNPQARCDDGKLDISTRRQKGIANIALAFISAANKSYKPKLMSYHTSQSIQISAADRIAVQIDGDPIDLPGDATVSIEPGAFQILIPKPSDS